MGGGGYIKDIAMVKTKRNRKKKPQKEGEECVFNEMDEDTTPKADSKTILDGRLWGRSGAPKKGI